MSLTEIQTFEICQRGNIALIFVSISKCLVSLRHKIIAFTKHILYMALGCLNVLYNAPEYARRLMNDDSYMGGRGGNIVLVLF